MLNSAKSDGSMPRRVLVVEDNDGLRNLVEKTLRTAGYDAEGVPTGVEAIARVTADPGLVLLLDQKLPDTTGSDLIRSLIERGLPVPFVTMTGQGNERLAVEMMKLGAADYLVKDVGLTDLLPVVFQRLFQKLETERRLRAAEEALRVKESAIESSINAIAISDLDANLTYVNPAFLRLWGYDDAQEVLGKSSVEFWHVQEKAAEIMAAVRNRQGWIGELAARKKDGSLFTAQIAASMIVDEAGRPLYLMGAFMDITERKRAEATRLDLERKLQQARKAESLGLMAGAVAHHYNNLMMVVLCNLELAMEHLPGGSGQPAAAQAGPAGKLAAAMSATRRASELGGLMLAYLGQTVARQEPLDFADACRQCLPDLRAAIPKEVALEADVPCPGPTIKANAHQIQQVLTHLTINACEAFGEGRGAIHVAVKTVSPADISATHRFPLGWQPQDNLYACLEVADAGSGIVETDIEKIFDPFYSTRFTGRGLGLPVVLGDVKAHSGCVTVDSAAGRGSVFRVFLPVTTEAVPRQSERRTGHRRRSDSDRRK